MTTHYPIVDYKALLQAPRRGPLGIMGRRRDAEELPAMQAHQVRVFRVDGEYVLDNGRRPLDDEQVVMATDVSVVDMSRNTMVSVELTVPSAEASEFTVRVSFLCTVTDPVTVVREGQRDAEVALRNYVSSHHRVFELGLEKAVSDINEVRQLVRTQLQAYSHERPPRVPGMAVSLANVEVLTPNELVELHKRLRAQKDGHHVAFDGARIDHLLRRSQVEHEQELDRMRQHYEARMERERRLSELSLAEDERKRNLAEVDSMDGTLRGDPDRTRMLAAIRGELSAKDIAHAQQEERDRWEIREERLWARQRQETVADREWTRVGEADTFDKKLRVLRELADKGHLDSIQVGLDRLLTDLGISAVMAPDEARGLPEAATQQLPGAAAIDGEADEEDDDYRAVREEDGV